MTSALKRGRTLDRLAVAKARRWRNDRIAYLKKERDTGVSHGMCDGCFEKQTKRPNRLKADIRWFIMAMVKAEYLQRGIDIDREEK